MRVEPEPPEDGVILGERAPAVQAPSITSEEMIYKPQLRPAGRDVMVITGARETRQLPWGFWGGVLMVVLAIGLLLTRGGNGLFSLRDLLITAGLGGLGLVMWRWGPRDSLRIQQLARLDMGRGLLSWSGADARQGGQLVVPLDQLTEIVFAMIYVPISAKRTDTRIHAFTLLVRGPHEELLPLIEASPHKQETFALAQALAQLTGLPISQVGEGVR